MCAGKLWDLFEGIFCGLFFIGGLVVMGRRGICSEMGTQVEQIGET